MPLIFTIAYYAMDALIYLLIGVAIISWFPIDPGNRWVRLLHAITDPILHPIRAIVPSIGGFSFDILVAVLLLGVIQRVFLRALVS
jgi:YggT family protein